MAGENYIVTRENGFLSVVQNRSYKTIDNKVHTWLIEDKELFFSCSLEKDYRISGALELEVSRGTGIKDYYIVVHTFNSVEKR